MLQNFKCLHKLIRNKFQFTTSVASLQSQQINTNVTVKTTSMNGCKYEPQDIKLMKIETPTEVQHDFKQEPDNEFADLVEYLYFLQNV